MRSSSNRLRLQCTEGRFTLTQHAMERMTTRGIRVDAIDAVLSFGRVVYIRGADIYAIGRNEVARYARDGVDLAAYQGIQIVVTSGGHILTVYRNRCFNGLRQRGTSWRRVVPGCGGPRMRLQSSRSAPFSKEAADIGAE